MNDLNILVLGTSIMWGQGLQSSEKMHYLLSEKLKKRYADRTVNVSFLAHSGSSTGYNRDGTIDMHQAPRLHGEVPTFYPTIVQQIAEFDDLAISADAVDLVLLDAGVNDVHVSTILDPLMSPRKIEKLVEIYCNQHVVLLFKRLLKKFQNARIVIIGYYPMLTESSEERFIRELLKALKKIPANRLADLIFGLFQRSIKRRLLANCATFAAASLEAFQDAAETVNGGLSSPRVFVVHSVVDNKHAAFSKQPWLFGIKPDLSPEDEMAPIRAEECACAKGRADSIICNKASVGHPNAKGARAYADAMYTIIQEQLHL